MKLKKIKHLKFTCVSIWSWFYIKSPRYPRYIVMYLHNHNTTLMPSCYKSQNRSYKVSEGPAHFIRYSPSSILCMSSRNVTQLQILGLRGNCFIAAAMAPLRLCMMAANPQPTPEPEQLDTATATSLTFMRRKCPRHEEKIQILLYIYELLNMNSLEITS